MRSENLSGVNEPSPFDSEARTWSVVAQLAFFANLSVPFGGLVATALIYALRKETVPVARENERAALNFEITLAILNGVLIAAYVLAFFSVFASAAAMSHAGTPAHAGPPAGIVVVLGFMGLISLIGVACALLSGFAARAAWLGRPVRYPLAIQFVR